MDSFSWTVSSIPLASYRAETHIFSPKKGVFGKQDNPTIVLSEIKQTIIYQFAGWSNNLLDVGDKFAESVKIKNFPKTNKAEGSVDTAILRIEPLKWWLVSTELWDEVTHPSFEFFDISIRKPEYSEKKHFKFLTVFYIYKK